MQTYLISLALLTLASLWLLIRGLRGKRIGNEPRCRKCDYDLTALTSDRCPECGWIIVQNRVRHGRRERHTASMAIGLILLLAMAVVATGVLNVAKLYPRAPFRLVLQLADWGSESAFAELVRRGRFNKLKATEEQKWADLWLDKQKAIAASRTTNDKQPIAQLEDLCIESFFTQAQLMRYQEQMISDIQFEIRPLVRSGDLLPVVLTAWQVGANRLIPGATQEFSLPIELDDRPRLSRWDNGRWEQLTDVVSEAFSGYFGIDQYNEPRLKSNEPRVGRATKEIFYDCTIPSGKYRLEFAWIHYTDAATHTGGRHIRRSPTATLTQFPVTTIQFTREFEVCPRDGPDSVKLIKSEELGTQLNTCFRPQCTQITQASSRNPAAEYRLTFEIDKPLPIGVAFDVFVPDSKGDKHLGRIWCEKGSRQLTVHIPQFTIPGPARSLSLVLRSSADAARLTTRMLEIWDGQIILEPAMIQRMNPPAPGSQSMAPQTVKWRSPSRSSIRKTPPQIIGPK